MIRIEVLVYIIFTIIYIFKQIATRIFMLSVGWCIF